MCHFVRDGSPQIGLRDTDCCEMIDLAAFQMIGTKSRCQRQTALGGDGNTEVDPCVRRGVYDPLCLGKQIADEIAKYLVRGLQRAAAQTPVQAER